MSKAARDAALARFRDNTRAKLNKVVQRTGIGLDLKIGLMTVDLTDWIGALTQQQQPQGKLFETGDANITGGLKQYRADMLNAFVKWVGKDSNHPNWESSNPRYTSYTFTFQWKWISNKPNKNPDYEVQNDVRVFLNSWLDRTFNSTQIERQTEVGNKGITYEHGSQREGMAMGPKIGRNFKGASVEARILNAFDYTKNIRNKNTTEIFRNYLIDYFGYDQTLLQNRSSDRFVDSFIIQGRMTFDDKTATMNPGKLDNMISRDFRRIFGGSGTKPSKEFLAIAEKYILDNRLNSTALDLWADSKNPKDEIIDAGIDAIVKNAVKTSSKIKRLTRPYKSKTKTARSSTLDKTLKGTKKVTSKRKPKTSKRSAVNNFGTNPIALKELINQQLPSAILPKMQVPALVNRTGRFRHSAEVTNVLIGPRGSTTIEYTYQRNPYEVFEPGSGSPLANQYRDPRAIIGGTIREIAQQIMGKKFIRTRRV